MYLFSLAVNDVQTTSASAILDLIGDSTDLMRSQRKAEKKWDPMKKKYVANNNKEKMIRSETGQWVPVTYKTNRYEKWQEKSKERNLEESDEETTTSIFTPSK